MIPDINMADGNIDNIQKIIAKSYNENKQELTLSKVLSIQIDALMINGGMF